MKKIVIVALVSLASTALFSQQVVSDQEVVNASDTLLKTLNDPRGWQTFQEVIRTENYAPDIRSRVMLLYAVRNLLQMNTNLFASATQKLRTRYPEEGPALADRLTPADWLVQCRVCGGTGVKQSSLPAAQGGSVRCLNCVGTGKIVELSPRVKAQVGTVLNEIKALAAENIQFAEAVKKALAEKNQQRCITALQELVSQYARRPDIDPVRQTLEKLEAEVAEREAVVLQKEAERALRNQEERDYRAIDLNLEKLPVSGIDLMVREIDSFIEKYPRSAYRLELEISKTQLERRKKTHGYLWTAFYVCAGVACVSLCFSLIKGLFTQRKRERGPLAVPGLTQTNEESDPLAGTFPDSDEL